MNITRYLVASIAVFIFIFAFEYAFHGMGLKEMYEATSSLWRPEEEMKQLFPWMLVAQFYFSLVLVFIFTRNYEGKGIGEGLRFGFYLGLLIAGMSASFYIFMPISLELAGWWFIGSLAEIIGAGIVASLFYKA